MTSPHVSETESPPVTDKIARQEQPGDYDDPKEADAPTKEEILERLPAKPVAVEKQLPPLSYRNPKSPTASPSVSACDYKEASSISEYKWQEQQQTWPFPVSAHVAMCNFQQFKTAVSAQVTRCAVEALVWSPTLNSDIDNFTASIRGSSIRRDIHMEHAKRLDVSNSEADHAFPPDETWIQDVRVNSHAVLSVLDRFSDNEGVLVKEPHIFRRPFLYFTENYKNICAKLEALQSQRRPSATKSVILLQGEGQKSDIAQTVEELRCFCQFVKKYIIPKYEALQDDTFARRQKIHYYDLDFIFRPGELVYVPASTSHSDELRDLSAHRRSAAQQTMFRLKSLGKGIDAPVRPSRRVPRIEGLGSYYKDDVDETRATKGLRPNFNYGSTIASNTWTARCYYIEFDGERYGAVNTDFDIPIFHEARHITELPFYPARFMENYADALKEEKYNGEKIVDLLSENAKHAHYSGWTLTNGPTGDKIEDSKGALVRFPEHIESDIIVDYDEAFKHNPMWKPSMPADPPNRSQIRTVTDAVPLVRWSISLPHEPIAEYGDQLVDFDAMRFRQWNVYLKGDAYCQDGWPHSPVRPEDLALLPRRIFAYSLWDRKFVQIDSHFINRKTREGQEGQSFEQLQIEQRSKDVIESLLYNHFNDMKAERAGIVVESQDLIRGKGRGVSILLHGKPGVGKTATAEAVAEKWQRPLFPITCGDLGYQADMVERSMNDIFRLAHLWGCILLLDEADIFITQRTNQELQRNGLVSVFLRMLEYYNGILFLTTNRTGVLDEAIKSRIHLHIGFDDLNEKQTVEIFKNNIGRLRARTQQRTDAMPGHRALQIDVDGILKFAENHYRSCNTLGRWNGRQIRNAFVVASSLANFEAEKRSSDWQPQLRAEHFHTVLEATMQYDRYRQSVFTMSDDALAFSRMERAEPTAPPAPSGTYGIAQNGSSFSAQQFPAQQQPQHQQQTGVFTGMQYGGATGAGFGHAAMQPSSTSSFPYNAGFAPSAQAPQPTQAGLYSGLPAFGYAQPIPSTQTQGQMYSQQHAQTALDPVASAQSHGGAQEQGNVNPGGSSNLRTRPVEPIYGAGATAAPEGWISGQGQAQAPHMQHGSVEGAQGRASGGGFQGRP